MRARARAKQSFNHSLLPKTRALALANA